MEWTGKDVLNLTVSGHFKRMPAAVEHPSVKDELICQIAIIGSHGKRNDERVSNFAPGFVDNMKRKDAAEALLVTQMAAIHLATMMLARKLNHVETNPQQDAAERAVNKLARTFLVQMDTLKRYRSKGQQVVRVERVTIHEGGQAIVGNVEGGACENS